MKTKIVYVLTSDESDYFLEMSLMSVWTARYHNPDAHIVLVTDEFTMKSLANGRGGQFISLFSDVKVVDTSRYDTKAKRSRYLKTTLRNIIEGDYLYIDSDTVICESLEEIDNIEGKMALAIDAHIEKQFVNVCQNEYTRKNWGKDIEIDKYFNGGVSFVRDCEETHQFFNDWYKDWNDSLKTGMFTDQPPFYRTILKHNLDIQELDGEWNCQLWGMFLPYFQHAKILHTSTGYQSNFPMDFFKLEIFCEIKNNKGLTDKLKERLLNPGKNFNPLHIVLFGEDNAKFFNSDVEQRAKFLFVEAKGYFRMLNCLSKILLTLFAYNQWIINKYKYLLGKTESY